MPRKNPVPKREREIGQRLREARELAGFDRVTMAKRAGIDSNRLASYEFGRAATPYSVGDSICEAAGACQRWLATGKQPRDHYFEVHSGVRAAMPPRTPFSVAYDKVLSIWIDEELEHVAKLRKVSPEALTKRDLKIADMAVAPPSLIGTNLTRELLLAAVQSAEALPNELRRQLATEFLTTATEFHAKHKKKVDAFLKQRPQIETTEAEAIRTYVLSALGQRAE